MRPGHHAHAGRGEQNQRAKFAGVQIVALQITDRAQNHEERRAADDPVNEQAECVARKRPE